MPHYDYYKHYFFAITMTPQSDDSQELILISHSHWDRAWYLPYQQFRFRLVKLIDRLLDLLEHDNNFHSFTLDGQTILLEDYLEIRPDKYGRIKQLISDERIIIGPWYVLPDLFLVSGEAVIRNLHKGKAMGDEFGGLSKVGYMPDPFGHWAQIPQILTQLGYQGFIFMRGMPIEEAERLKLYFEWEAPDGSSTEALYLKEGYFNASALGYPSIIGRFDHTPLNITAAKEQVEESINELNEVQHLPVIPLFNGMDHMPGQTTIPRVLKKLKEDHDVSITHLSIDQMWSKLSSSVKPQEVFKGDLLGNAHHPILSSVFSTRIYLKQQNHHAQSLLERYLEPLLLNQRIQSERLPDHAFLDHAWQELLKNHPHDDICGCSADQVHRDNEYRFAKVEEIGESLISNALEHFYTDTSPDTTPFSDARTQIFVFNPHPFNSKQTVTAEIFFPNPDGEFGDPPPFNKLNITDAEKNTIPHNIIRSDAPELRCKYLEHTWGRRYLVSFEAEIDGLGYHIFEAELTSEEVSEQSDENMTAGVLQNENYRVKLEKGQITLFHCPTKTKIEDLLCFEFEQDNGDTYTYGPLKDGITYGSTYEGFDQTSPHEATLYFSMHLPGSLDDDEITELPIKVTLRLCEQHLETDIQYTNTVRDGRLRARFKSIVQTDLALVDAHFRLAERTEEFQQTPESDPERYQAYPGEMNYSTFHQGDFALLEDDSHTCWIANRGHPEAEIKNSGSGTDYLITLHRSVGKLSTGNGRIRRVQAGPAIDTPEAQCLRTFNHSFALGISTDPRFEIINRAASFSHPFMVREMPYLPNAPGIKDQNIASSLLRIDNPAVRLSSLRLNKDNDIVLRVVNLSETTQKVSIYNGMKAKRYSETDLWDRWNPDSSHIIESDSIDITIKPHSIRTFVLR